MTHTAAIIPAAGSGKRMRLNQPKQYHLLAGLPILVHTVRAFHRSPSIDEIIVVVPHDWLSATKHLLEDHQLNTPSTKIIVGGTRRQDSVFLGLSAISKSADIVLVHDGARPLVSQELISECRAAAIAHGAAIAALPVKDTLKKATPDGVIATTIDRENLWQAQTPQAAKVELLHEAYAQAKNKGVTDEASLLELSQIPVRLIEGAETNLKITRPEDLVVAEKILMKNQQPPRIGHGFDAHRLVTERALVLGGIKIPHTLGLAGHSDADVLTHALCDAILGAMGAGDIGSHFPDTDNSYKDIYSITLLEKVIELMFEKKLSLSNADITLVCQAPKLAPYITEMIQKIAESCQTEIDRINIKATTTEKMGFIGRGEGISCHAVVLLA